MKKYFVVGMTLLGLVACTNEQKIMKENYAKVEDQFIK